MQDEIEIFRRQKMGNRIGFGQSPALLVIDFQVGFTQDDKFGGYNINEAMRRTEDLLAAARAKEIPIAHTRVIYAGDGSDSGVFTLKVPTLATLTEDNPDAAFVPGVAPKPGELVVTKLQASAFFNTPLAAWLTQRRIDTLLIAGCTTSGCVRASVVDALGWNLRPVVVRDCVGDRARGPHESSLFDLEQKYADVLDAAEVIDWLGAWPQAATA